MENVIIGDAAAAEYLGVTVQTLRVWRLKKIIPFTKLGGKKYYSIDALNALILKKQS